MKTKTHTTKKANRVLSLCAGLLSLSSMTAHTQAQNLDPGDRAHRFRGTLWGGIHPKLLSNKFLNLKTMDGWGIRFNEGATGSARHAAPVPHLSSLPGGNACFPGDANTTIQDHIDKIRGAGCMVRAYSNADNFIGSNANAYKTFAASWKEWCDTNPEAQAFIDSQPYHRKEGKPNRPYMFCYAEFVIKHYSLQYGKGIDIWIFDSAKTIAANGDNATSGAIGQQRLYQAFADAARAGNDNIAVAFNNDKRSFHGK